MVVGRVFQLLREELKAASEFVATEDTAGPMTSSLRIGPDALSVQGTQIGRNIRSFDDARRSYLTNERLHIFKSDSSPTGPNPTAIFPPPSMRKTLEEEGDDTGIVERLADKIAREEADRETAAFEEV
ncbi:hypothetical protein BDP27DRAFT_1419971 [Rhodocollybia butyracea]|uniref:Uncharacterized protein n=1 Tax=Rhodocollybia butyracea TaxID=206335 RepID=A0A9P5PW63_9AGAR|nr:hypothetical protein BDP27DRAFT_1419971 [Rhodocollybia butyracea]